MQWGMTPNSAEPSQIAADVARIAALGCTKVIGYELGDADMTDPNGIGPSLCRMAATNEMDAVVQCQLVRQGSIAPQPKIFSNWCIWAAKQVCAMHHACGALENLLIVSNEADVALLGRKNRQKVYMRLIELLHTRLPDAPLATSWQVTAIDTLPHKGLKRVHDLLPGSPCITYYPQWHSPSYWDVGLSEVEAYLVNALDRWTNLLGRPVTLIETSVSSAAKGGTPEIQARYIREVLPAIAESGMTDAICWWGLHSFPEPWALAYASGGERPLPMPAELRPDGRWHERVGGSDGREDMTQSAYRTDGVTLYTGDCRAVLAAGQVALFQSGEDA